MQVDDAERGGLDQVIEEARKQKEDRIVIGKRKRRERIWKLQSVASPGPSGWRNPFRGIVAQSRSGVKVLKGWCTLRAEADVSENMAVLWTAAVAPN